MIKLFASTMVVVLPLALSGCDTGTYTPSAHRSADASTGSMLSGVDTGMDPGTDLNNPSLRNNNTHPAGGNK